MKIQILLIILLISSCTREGAVIDINGQTIKVSFIHTSDIHSRIIPYRMNVAYTDEMLGLVQENEPFGGAARGAFIIKREKTKADRVLHLDSGDVFQGAPIFNFNKGEAEIRFLSAIGCDAAVLGNHEFDAGSENLAEQLMNFANFSILSANYLFENPKLIQAPNLANLAVPFTTFNLKGLKVGVIGMSNMSSMHSIYETGNSHGITPLETIQTAQFYIDLLKPQVNLIVILSHLGLNDDEFLIKGTTGIDLVLGGHHHIVLNPPKVVDDCQFEEVKENKKCTPRRVLMVHSGAFLKYIGRLDVSIKQRENDPTDWDIISHKYQVIPVDSSIPEDSYIKEMLEPYIDKMDQLIDLNLIIGYASTQLSRFGTIGGDSAVGNLIATAMWTRHGVETDFALTNTTGIRDNIYPGPLTVDQMFQIFPFENTITTLFLSGREVIELFDYVARRSSMRGCNSQAQIAGARVVLKCGECDVSQRPSEWPKPMPGACAYSIKIGGNDIIPDMQYSFATNNYIAQGGSGYAVLKKNTTQQDTGIPQRDALIDYIRGGKSCGYNKEINSLKQCTTDNDCPEKFICGCNERAKFNVDLNACEDEGQCSDGYCVIEPCVNDFSNKTFLGYECISIKEEAISNKCFCNAKKKALNQCMDATCIDDNLGAMEDGRIKMISP